MGPDTLSGVFKANFQITLENVCVPDVSANSVLVLLYVPIINLGHRNMSFTDTSGFLLSRHRKMSAYIYLNIQHVVF